MIKNAFENLFHLFLYYGGRLVMLLLLAAAYLPFAASYKSGDAFWAALMYFIVVWGAMELLWKDHLTSKVPFKHLGMILGPFALASLISYITCGVAGNAGMNWALNVGMGIFITLTIHSCLTVPSANRRRRGEMTGGQYEDDFDNLNRATERGAGKGNSAACRVGLSSFTGAARDPFSMAQSFLIYLLSARWLYVAPSYYLMFTAADYPYWQANLHENSSNGMKLLAYCPFAWLCVWIFCYYFLRAGAWIIAGRRFRFVSRVAWWHGESVGLGLFLSNFTATAVTIYAANLNPNPHADFTLMGNYWIAIPTPIGAILLYFPIRSFFKSEQTKLSERSSELSSNSAEPEKEKVSSAAKSSISDSPQESNPISHPEPPIESAPAPPQKIRSIFADD